MRKSALRAVCLLALLSVGTVAAFDGVGLFSYKWTSSTLQGNEGVVICDFSTGDTTKLWGKNGSGSVTAAAFSLDGTEIIFSHNGKMYIMDNDGSRARSLPLSGPCNPDHSLCWTTNGVFWVGGGSIWRYVMETNELTELHHWDDLISGSTKGYWSSRDGRKGWCWAELDDGTPEDTHGDQAFITFAPDWTVSNELRAPIWGHGNYMSFSGETLLFDKWSMAHQNIQYVRHSDAVPFDTVFTKLPPGAEIQVFDAMQPCQNDSQLIMLRTSPSESGRTGNYVADFYVWNWVTESTPERVPEAYKGDGKMMWKGALPEIVITDPWITLDRDEYIFWNIWRHTESIPITNTGGGTLGTVDLTVNPPEGWFDISLISSNDTQFVNVKPNLDSLPGDSTYEITITISGGGATNSVDLKVYKVRGELPMIPEPMSAYTTGATDADVLLTWKDRDDKETGFEVQRRTDSTSWATITTTGIDEATYTDPAPGYTTFFYRVRAVNANGHSAYSDSVEVTVSGIPSVNVTFPTADTALAPGDTVFIEWTAHLIDQVQIWYTANEGEDWTEITTTGGVLRGNPDWGHKAWVVPDTSAPSVQIWIHKYGTPPEGGVSGVFSIGAVQASSSPREALSLATALQHSPAFFHRGGMQSIPLTVAEGDRAVVHIMRLDGTTVRRIRVDQCGKQLVAWDGRDSDGRMLGAGMYLMRMDVW